MAKKAILPEIESRTVPLSVKVTERIAQAIGRAAKDNSRTKSALVAGVLEIWLREHGYLK